MANIEIDTNRLNSDGRRILELTRQYDVIVNNMFDELRNNVKQNWNGQAANNYINNLKYELDFFKKFSSQLSKYGDELVKVSNQLDRKIKKWERE